MSIIIICLNEDITTTEGHFVGSQFRSNDPPRPMTNNDEGNKRRMGSFAED